MKPFKTGDRVVIVKDANDVCARSGRVGMTGVIVDDKDYRNDWYSVQLDDLRLPYSLHSYHMEPLNTTPAISSEDLMEVLL